MSLRLPLLTLLCALLLAALGAGAAADEGAKSRAAVFAQVSLLTKLGRALFFDPALSASGKMSCATCHDPAHAFGPPNALPVQLGGADLRQPGLRAVPSLKYLQVVPQFTEHYYDSDDEGDASVDNGPTGGLTWDGRVDRGRDQARMPLLSPYEMANHDASAVVAAVRISPLAQELRAAFGPHVFDNDDTAFDGILQALEAYEQSYRDFYPYSSKYDAYLAGRATLTAQEARGLDLFNDPEKGNCAHCHISAVGNDGTPPQFTDYGFAALGVPRNKAITANADPAYYDLGLCGPQRDDLKERPEYCGMFMTPSLRNVALRRSFFHNGIFHTLKEAVEFYATRDTDPGHWYPRAADGSVQKFDDLPAQYRDNVNEEPPFDRKPGEAPALTDAEIDDILAFLRTLTDGYGPGTAASSGADLTFATLLGANTESECQIQSSTRFK